MKMWVSICGAYLSEQYVRTYRGLLYVAFEPSASQTQSLQNKRHVAKLLMGSFSVYIYQLLSLHSHTAILHAITNIWFDWLLCFAPYFAL